MISERAWVWWLICLIALLSVGSHSVAATADHALRRFINSIPELQRVFASAEVHALSSSRAEAVAQFGTSRHAVVIYQAQNQAAGDTLCHAALGRPERRSWRGRLAELAGGDQAIATQLAMGEAPQIFFKDSEYRPLPTWNGWQTGVCTVPEAELRVTYPALPGPQRVQDATYQRAKQLYKVGKTSEALDKFKTLKDSPALYANALLYIVVILHERRPDIARHLRDTYVDLDKVSDAQALEVYATALATQRPCLDRVCADQ